ncbi:MAG: response regulator transcription factor [Actinomycetota bacterium]|nr:response regulator transcription factor [Actinomycetota bacterium]
MRVVIADDSVLLREGLARLLAELGIETVAQAGDAEELIRAAELHQPDVAIIDIRMPPTWSDEGVVAATQLRSSRPDLGILLLSQHLDLPAAMALGNSGRGGSGYLLKERVANAGELADALERVHAGQTVLDPEVVQSLLQRNRGHTDGFDNLTQREREVLALMAEGRSNGAIARHLGVAQRTIESHVAAIFDKLDLPLGQDDHRRVLAVRSWLSKSSS